MGISHFFQTLSYYCTCYIQGLQKHIKTLCRLAKVIPFSNYELVFYCTTWTTTQGSCARVGVQETQQATDLAVHTCIPAHESSSYVLTKITPGHQGTNMPKPVPDTPAPNFSEESTTLVPVRGGGRGREVGVWESSPKRAGKWKNNLRGCLELNPDKTLLYTPVWPWSVSTPESRNATGAAVGLHTRQPLLQSLPRRPWSLNPPMTSEVTFLCCAWHTDVAPLCREQCE